MADGVLADGRWWTKVKNMVYMETAMVIPSRFVNATIKELHVKLGHPGQEGT